MALKNILTESHWGNGYSSARFETMCSFTWWCWPPNPTRWNIVSSRWVCLHYCKTTCRMRQASTAVLMCEALCCVSCGAVGSIVFHALVSIGFWGNVIFIGRTHAISLLNIVSFISIASSWAVVFEVLHFIVYAYVCIFVKRLVRCCKLPLQHQLYVPQFVLNLRILQHWLLPLNEMIFSRV